MCSSSWTEVGCFVSFRTPISVNKDKDAPTLRIEDLLTWRIRYWRKVRKEAKVVQRDDPQQWRGIVDLVHSNLQYQREARELAKLAAPAIMDRQTRDETPALDEITTRLQGCYSTM